MTELNAMSETDASNTSISGANVAENCPMSGLNDAIRNLTGMAKRAYDRDHGGAWCTVGGTANAITLAYTSGPASYVTGEKFAFKATAANTGATTVNISALGAKSIFRRSGSGAIALTGGEIQSGDLVEIEYDGTQFQIMSHPSNIAPSFLVYLSANQTGLSSGTPAKVTFDTTSFDANSWYDGATNHRFQPLIAGQFLITASVFVAGTGRTQAFIDIQKNGASVFRTLDNASSTSGNTLTVQGIVSFNGSTDYIEITGSCTGSGSLQFNGGTGPFLSWLEGYWIAP